MIIKIGIVVARNEARFPREKCIIAGQLSDGVCGECDGLVMSAGGLKLISGAELD